MVKHFDENGNFQDYYDDQVDNYKQDHYQFHWNERYNNNWSTKIRKAPLNFSNSFSIGDQKLFFGKELGYIFGLRYCSSIRYDPNGISQRIGFESQGFPFENQIENVNGLFMTCTI